jgi:hypothetical protein
MQIYGEISMRKRIVVWTSLAAVGVLSFGLTPAIGASMGPDGEYGYSDGPESVEIGGAAEYEEKLALPVVPTKILEQASAIEGEFTDRNEFNTVEISDDRSHLIVWWHGEVDSKLQDYLVSDDVPMTVRQTPYMPGEMKAMARRLVDEVASTGVVTSYVTKDGAAIKVTLNPEKSASKSEAQARLSQWTGFPVVVEEGGSVAPAALERQLDTYVLGGARLYQAYAGNGCSSGFSVLQGTNKGMMFAAHCGPLYSDWVVWPGSGAAYWYGNWGEVQFQATSRDGAIISTEWNNPAVYIGPWNSSGSYSFINGVSSPVTNAEICYSGSYSGNQCGNIVLVPSFNYSLDINGTTTTVTGAYTVEASGNPTVGSGDSGGPGYIVASDGGAPAKRYASVIISGTDGSSGYCNGVPASGSPFVPGSRWCSDKVAATSVGAILVATGWTISYVP